MISVDQALAHCLALARPTGAEDVPLRDATGRVLRQDAVALRDQPPFDASAMDGYAIAVPPRPGAEFQVVGEAGAGHAFGGDIGPGQALRIFTGAPLPRGATHVVIQEDVVAQGRSITLNGNLDAGTNVRPRGQDFAAGARLAAPRRLRPNDLALLAAMNIPRVTVARRPVVAIIPTGDELVMPGEVPRDDQIICSNSFAIAALVEAAGATARLLPIAPDQPDALAHVLGLAAGADLIVTIGGASVGDHDLIAPVTARLGMERAFYKIAMRPGKPLMAGRLGQAALLGLPGNPVSSIVCTHLFVLPMVAAMLGLPGAAPRPFRAVLGADVAANGVRAHYMRARLTPGDGLPQIAPFDRQDSALISVLTDADALLIRPVGDGPRRAGETVTYLPL